MNKYIYKVRYVTLKFLYITIRTKITANKQFNYSLTTEKLMANIIIKSLRSMNASCLFS